MSRFMPTSEVQDSHINKHITNSNQKYPFKNLYGCAEGSFIYINMEAAEELTKGMTTLRDVALIVDISASMAPYYKDGSVESLCTQIIDRLASYDDDGIDILFFSNGLVHRSVVSNASEVRRTIQDALASKNSYQSTMPTQAFREFADQLKKKRRAGTVLFLTDGAMDDAGKELKSFYQNVLHTEFKTRDQFYCYSIEFGHMAFGALNVLDGLYAPEQGPEDLFDLESATELNKIADVLSQVGGMSAIGSQTKIVANVNNNAKIDMVNTDLIEGGISSIRGEINKIMSFRVLAQSPFEMTIEVEGYSPMRVKVIPKGIEVELQIL